MKLDNHIKQKDKVQNIAEVPQKREHKLLGSIKPKKGHLLFEINEKTGEIALAEFEKVASVYDNNRVLAVNRKVIAKEGYCYIAALNKENAMKRFNKRYSR